MTQTEDSSGNIQPPPVDVKENVSRNCAYTMHGVLHYLQHEWSKYDMEKARWEMERAELQARISFLQGERKGQENLKADLIRRIKMLEYCLKQERAKNYRLTHNGEDPPPYEEQEVDEGQENLVPSEVEAYATEGAGGAGWKQGRQLLKQYLQEIGYSETILDVRSFRVKNLLGLIPEGDWPNNDRDRKDGSGKRDDDSLSDGDGDEKSKNLDAESAVDASFKFLDKSDSDSWGAPNKEAVDRLKEAYKNEQQRKRHAGYDEQDDDQAQGQKNSTGAKPRKGGRAALNPFTQQYPGPADRGEFMDIDGALGIKTDDTREIDIKTNFEDEDDDPSIRHARWSGKPALRSHLDSVRAMQFHPVEPVLFTASDDGTIKMWNLDPPKKDDKHGADGLEPIYTFRGHLGPVICMDLSISGDTLYTGGFDGVVCCWNVPSSTIDQHAAYDPRVLFEKIRGHKDIIWSVAYHSSDNRLVSAGADNVIKVWEPGNFSEPLLKTIPPPRDDVGCPVSVDFVSTEPSQLLVAYKKNYACLIDVETTYLIRAFDFGTEDPACQLNRILSHPTMPITVIAASDRKIRYFDNTTGNMTASTVAHMDAVSSLAIDPNGLYLLSGSHDGSLRLWNIEKKVCLQEMSAHRKKYDAAVLSVAFHPSRPIIGSTGADGLVKVFTSSSE